jgi:tetratricopeptide (TPR) repeat protein
MGDSRDSESKKNRITEVQAMTRNEVKRILNSYKEQQSKIKMLKATYDFWLGEIGKLGANDYGAVKVKNTAGNSSPQERYVICYENAKERYEKAIEAFEKIVEKIENLCECLLPRERNFITDAYMTDKLTYQIQCEYELTGEAYRKFKTRIIEKIILNNKNS